MDSISDHRLASRGRDSPERAVLSNNGSRAPRRRDREPLEKTPVAVVVLRMLDHREPERVGHVADAHLNAIPGEIRRVDPKRVGDDRLPPIEPHLDGVDGMAQRMLRGERTRGDETGDCEPTCDHAVEHLAIPG